MRSPLWNAIITQCSFWWFLSYKFPSYFNTIGNIVDKVYSIINSNNNVDNSDSNNDNNNNNDNSIIIAREVVLEKRWEA